MANPTIRGREAIWSIVTVAGDTYVAGIIQRQTHEKTGEQDYIYDNEGFTITDIFFDDRDECEIDILVESDTSVPDRGDDIQIVGLACIVRNVQIKWEKKAWKMLTVSAAKFINLVE